MKFPCIACGLCCRRVGPIAERLKGTALEFPYTYDESGRCEMLGEDNRCKVYDSRPLICNVERVAELSGKDKAAFYEENIRACNQMMDEAGLPAELRIKEDPTKR